MARDIFRKFQDEEMRVLKQEAIEQFETMTIEALRLLKRGESVDEVARKTDLSLDYIEILNKVVQE